MSRLWARVARMFSNRTMVGVDKSGNRYFARKEEIDGVMKEKRYVIFKAEEDPTSIPVEWICWLNGQRKKAPTPEEMMELEARRELVKLNVARLKQEEEERRSKEGGSRLATSSKVGGPDLKSFINQFPAPSKGDRVGELSNVAADTRTSDESETDKNIPHKPMQQPESSEPTGSGESFRPGTWQPPM